jgi:hypothetical protein
MTFPFHAKYGFKNNSHDLLGWDGEGQLPSELLGLTDKPAGHISPSEKWWPAVNCGRVGDWWAIWLIEPDPEAPRGGMVKSQVLLWPINEISKVKDLGEFISTLFSQKIETPSETNQLIICNLFNELTSNNQILIVDSVELIPHIIESLWINLWGEAKENFAIRVSFAPPQSFNSAKHPTFYCVPSSLTNQWFNKDVKVLSSIITTELSRAAKYLSGYSDKTINELVEACGLETGKIQFIGRLARAANNIELFREQGNASNTIASLRSILACSGKVTAASGYKTELMQALKAHINKNTISVEEILSLSNISEENIDKKKLPKQELINWVSDSLLNVAPERFSNVFDRCSPEKSKKWWCTGVEIGIQNLLDTTKADEALLSWLLMDSFSSLAEKFVYTASNIDHRLFELANGKRQKFSPVELRKLESIALNNNFPQLYSIVIHQIYSESLLFNKLINSMKGWEKGVPFLVEKLQGLTLLDAIEIEELNFIIPSVASRSNKDVNILKGIDIANKGAFILWCMQLENKGGFYPPNVDKNSFRKKLYVNLNSKLSNELLGTIVSELYEYVLKQSDRTDFWKIFDSSQRKILADKLVAKIVHFPNLLFNIKLEEKELIQAITDYFNSNLNIPSIFLISFLELPLARNEHDILKWIFKVNRSDWSMHAGKLGEIILLRQWKSIAKTLYKESCGFLANKSYLKPAVVKSESLLSPWERTVLGFSSGTPSTSNREQLVNRLSSIAAGLAYDRLETIWVSVGGNSGVLHTHGTAFTKWHYAIKAADAGALSGGMKDILNQLLEDYPNNRDLQELRILI